MAYIELMAINKSFTQYQETRHILQNFSLTMEKGDFITVVGGNGAGKSTLLNALAGSLFVDSGNIIIDTQDVTQLNEYKRAKFISRVFQNATHGTAERMTIAENMALAYKKGQKKTLRKNITQDNRTFFKEQLALLGIGLENRLDTEMGALSGGQRQAVSLIMAMLSQPKLLLLDEHTSALDPKMQKVVMEMTNYLVTTKNITTLMITHNIQDALQYGNRMILLKNGTVERHYSKDEKTKLTPTDVLSMYM